MCYGTQIEQLVADRKFASLEELRKAITQLVGDSVFFDEFGEQFDGQVRIMRQPLDPRDWQCDVLAQIV